METSAISSGNYQQLFEASKRTRASEKAHDHLARGSDQLAKASLDESHNPDDKKDIEKLKARDREVRAHEQAHKSAAGRFATGAASFDFETGPDGQQYAVGGEVQIDTSEVPGDPEATVQKMRAIRAAALAPADPSPQDQKVAAEASRKASEAQAEIRDPDEPALGKNIDISV